MFAIVDHHVTCAGRKHLARSCWDLSGLVGTCQDLSGDCPDLSGSCRDLSGVVRRNWECGLSLRKMVTMNYKP